MSSEGTQSVLPDIIQRLGTAAAAEETRERGARILGMLSSELTPEHAPWFSGADPFADAGRRNCVPTFDSAFDRWRSLYRSALYQRDQARRLLDDHTQPREVHLHAKRDQNVATDLLIALRDGDQGSGADFNLYRYLATEGFLPGYNFPRLPLLACIPGERDKEHLIRAAATVPCPLGVRPVVTSLPRRSHLSRRESSPRRRSRGHARGSRAVARTGQVVICEFLRCRPLLGPRKRLSRMRRPVRRGHACEGICFASSMWILARHRESQQTTRSDSVRDSICSPPSAGQSVVTERAFAQ